MKFVKRPNCPENCSRVIISCDTPKSIVDGLENLGINVIYGGKIGYEVEGVRCHIDTQIAHIGESKFVVSPHLYKHYSVILPGAELISGESVGQASYPDDAAYNIASTGKYIIHNFKYTDKNILENITGEKIEVSQGYSKCSICIVDEKSFITEDEGIARTLRRHNIDVLKISAGDVKLGGLDYGFLGGASGKLSRNILAFAGDITSHRDYGLIRKFCMDRNVEPVSLCEGELLDIGSIIPVFEKE